MDTNKLKELAERATPTGWTHDADRYVVAQSDQVNDGWNICLCEGPDSKKNRDFIAAANPKAVLALLDEIDRLKAENEELRGALQAVQAEVDGNLRPLTRDLVNMVSGLKNGSHPNDIYEHCDEIERIIGAAIEGAKQ
ncbi:TPA: ead/Ea22-like family protein [Pseudomonas aeruginosa]